MVRERRKSLVKSIREFMELKSIDAEIVADEWCNTFEDVKDFSLALKQGIWLR